MALRNFGGQTKEVNLFADGIGFLGKTKSCSLPSVKTKKETLNGMHVDSGLIEPMEFEAELNSFNALIYKEMAKLQTASLKAKGALVEGGVKKTFVATLQGPIDVDMDGFEAGNAVSKKIKMMVNVYHLEIDGVEVLNIDLPNYIAKIAGVDIYEEIRNAVS